MKTKFRLREKEKIFKNIRENGYAILDNIYSKKHALCIFTPTHAHVAYI